MGTGYASSLLFFHLPIESVAESSLPADLISRGTRRTNRTALSKHVKLSHAAKFDLQTVLKPSFVCQCHWPILQHAQCLLSSSALIGVPRSWRWRLEKWVLSANGRSELLWQRRATLWTHTTGNTMTSDREEKLSIEGELWQAGG